MKVVRRTFSPTQHYSQQSLLDPDKGENFANYFCSHNFSGIARKKLDIYSALYQINQ